VPVCTAKHRRDDGGFYQSFLNDRYLSLSMGSENFKFKVRNINEDLIFKNEDEMYKLDSQIEMYEKCLRLMQQELKNYDTYYKTNGKGKYVFPKHKF